MPPAPWWTHTGENPEELDLVMLVPTRRLHPCPRLVRGNAHPAIWLWLFLCLASCSRICIVYACNIKFIFKIRRVEECLVLLSFTKRCTAIGRFLPSRCFECFPMCHDCACPTRPLFLCYGTLDDKPLRKHGGLFLRSGASLALKCKTGVALSTGNLP